METFSALLALCAGNSPATGEFPAQRPVTRSFDVFFDLRMNKRLSKQSWGWWFETPSCSIWRHCNAGKIISIAWFLIFWRLICLCRQDIIGHDLIGQRAWHRAWLSGEPDYFGRNKILSGYDLSHYQVPYCIRVFFYFVWFVFIHHNFQFYFKLCTYCNILDIYLS